MKKFFAAVFALVLLTAATVHAETKTYTGNGEYLMTDETIDFAKKQAELSAERNILDQICVYVKGNSTTIDNELDNDEVITISAGILHVTDTKFSVDDNADGLLVKAIVTAQVDTDELETLLEQAIAQRRGKKNLSADKNSSVEQKIQAGNERFQKNDFDGAIKFYDEALALEPNNVVARYGRGAAYGRLQKYDAALADFNAVIELQPDFADAYKDRALVYFYTKKIGLAKVDIEKLIELKPNFATGYVLRAMVYGGTKDFEKALADLNKAIELDPKIAEAYQIRGLIYQELNDEAKAQADFAKAKELGFKN